MYKKDTGNIYYNAVINNKVADVFNNGPIFNHDPILAKYDQTESQTIINDPSEYFLSVIRFQIPGNLIPLYFEVGYFDGINPNRTSKSVSMSIGGGPPLTQTFLIYVPHNQTLPVPTLPITVNNIQYYALSSYQQIVDEINVGLASAFAGLTVPVLVPPLAAPYMQYNSTTQLFSLVADQRYVANNIAIYFNSDLYDLFLPTFETFFYGYDNFTGGDYQILIKNNNNNSSTVGGINYYTMTQESKSINNITDFRTIVLTVNNVPIRYESIPSSTQAAQSIQSNFLPILTDFIPALTNTANEIQTELVYYPTAEYRLVDLVGSNPINNVQLQVFWGNRYDQLFPLYIPAHYSASIKLLFRNKSLYNIGAKK